MNFINRVVLLFFSIVALAGCVHVPPQNAVSSPADEVQAALSEADIPGDQLLVVIGEGNNTSRVQTYALERVNGKWTSRFTPIPSIIGRNGFAPSGEKREGDGRTPSGLYPLESVFGYAPAVITKMPYRQATEDDIWVDDVNAPDYNTWVKRSESKATSFEDMKLPTHVYRHGIVVGYNRNPIVKGFGSAIFVHVWREEGKTSGGCISFDEDQLVKLIGWLDPARKPMILMGNRSDFASMHKLEKLATAARLAPPDALEQQVRAKLDGVNERIVESYSPDGFFGMAVAVPPSVSASMKEKKSWREGCPIQISDLSYLVLTHWGFDGVPKVGELVVHKKLALPVIKAFSDLYSQKFPIERMDLIEAYDADDDRSMAANNTSAFNCRDVPGRPGVWSNHSYGGAIDINPVQNPYIFVKSDSLNKLGWDGKEEISLFIRHSGFDTSSPVVDFCKAHPTECNVLPPAACLNVKRDLDAAGLIKTDSTTVKAFTNRGFDWGGKWKNDPDYQHFDFDRDILTGKKK
ncbi:L,D-transpeptidase catalytic domain [Geobacter sp. OR-1]|uniref:M15 family metallopeptidase n=1 Tax=Geobacter sp. OR-1 TaxID=1266765 RepID=UPI0005433DFA|nr:M15 family metallopeptidase [Geobacter sp. OR-1]GAM11195.1 L,D-transpeptidase catalytic domain [Geobacter sp. OR-1]